MDAMVDIILYYILFISIQFFYMSSGAKLRHQTPEHFPPKHGYIEFYCIVLYCIVLYCIVLYSIV